MTPAPDHAEDAPPPMPRWVKVFVVIIVAALLMLVVLKVIGGGGHGPGRHRASADTARTHQSHR